MAEGPQLSCWQNASLRSRGPKVPLFLLAVTQGHSELPWLPTVPCLLPRLAGGTLDSVPLQSLSCVVGSGPPGQGGNHRAVRGGHLRAPRESCPRSLCLVLFPETHASELDPEQKTQGPLPSSAPWAVPCSGRFARE